MASIKDALRRMTEEYCWAITQVMGHICCDRSHTIMLGDGFQLDSLVYTQTADHIFSVSTCAGPSETHLLHKLLNVCTQSDDRMVIEER